VKEMSGTRDWDRQTMAKAKTMANYFARARNLDAPLLATPEQAYDGRMTVATLMTAEELLALPDDGSRYELVQGELKTLSPTGARHARVAARIIARLIDHVEPRRLGAVFSSEGGFRLAHNPDTVRAPDVAFVRTERVVDVPGYFEGAPDVAIEVVSPSDRYSEVHEKTLQWLRAGTRAVVLVDPKTRSITIHRPDGAQQLADSIRIDDILPGWEMSSSDVFDL